MFPRMWSQLACMNIAVNQRQQPWLGAWQELSTAHG